MSLKIIGTGRGIPKRAVTNQDLATLMDTNDEWISTRTGIKNRYICTDETLTDLCIKAVDSALTKANISIGEIDMIIGSTFSGDNVTPSLACSVAEKFGASCPAYDINAACSGFIYALDIAQMYLSLNKAQNILIICAEMISRYTDWQDRSTCVLFGDGAGACVVTKGEALKYLHLTAGFGVESLFIPASTGNSPFMLQKNTQHYLKMNGQEIFKFAVSMIESESKLAFSKLGITAEDIDYFILHQANKRIIESARTRLKQPEEKFPTNIHQYGNVSSASIPILLDEMLVAGRIKKGDTLLMSAFGAGLTTGTCIMVWE